MGVMCVRVCQSKNQDLDHIICRLDHCKHLLQPRRKSKAQFQQTGASTQRKSSSCYVSHNARIMQLQLIVIIMNGCFASI